MGLDLDLLTFARDEVVVAVGGLQPFRLVVARHEMLRDIADRTVARVDHATLAQCIHRLPEQPDDVVIAECRDAELRRARWHCRGAEDVLAECAHGFNEDRVGTPLHWLPYLL